MAVASPRHTASRTTNGNSGSHFVGLSYVRVAVLLLFVLTAGWLLFAIMYHEDTLEHDMDGIVGAMPAKPVVRRRRPFTTPAPAVRPLTSECAQELRGERNSVLQDTRDNCILQIVTIECECEE